MTWSAVASIVFSALKAMPSSVIAYMTGVWHGKTSQRKKELERNVKAQKEFGRIASEHRTADDASDRLRGGDF